jgi:hypothetical protein
MFMYMCSYKYDFTEIESSIVITTAWDGSARWAEGNGKRMVEGSRIHLDTRNNF